MPRGKWPSLAWEKRRVCTCGGGGGSVCVCVCVEGGGGEVEYVLSRIFIGIP